MLMQPGSLSSTGTPVLRLLVFVALLTVLGRMVAQTSKGNPLPEAERLFKEERWAEARTAYAAINMPASAWHTPLARRVVQRLVTCSLRLNDWEDAWQRVDRFRRQAQAGPFERDRWHQWNRKDQEARDGWRAIQHFDLTRALLRRLAAHLQARPRLATPERLRRVTSARIEVDFALVDHLLGGGFDTHYSRRPDNDWWWAPSDPLGQDRAEAEDGWDADRRGIPIAPDGRLQFVATPPRYTAGQGPGANILFLLREITQLDTTATRDPSARALLKRALIARRLYGPASDPAWDSAEFYYRFDQRPSFGVDYRVGPGKPFWELADDEARTLVAGRVQVIKLPATENPLELLRLLQRKYPRSNLVPEAIHVRGLYHQSRQQFGKAIGEYRALLKAYPRHPRAAAARKHIDQIRHADVLLGRTGIYPVGSKPALWFAHRQTDRVEFSARPVDLWRYLQDAAGNRIGRDFTELRYFGYNFFPDVPHRYAEDDTEERLGKYLGKKQVRWSETVLPRAERVTTQTTHVPITGVGAYVVEARTPGRKQVSRALVVLTDIAIVHRHLAGRSLVFVADALTGRPLANQEVQFVVEGKTKWERAVRKTNPDGIIEEPFRTEHDVVALVRSGGGGVAFATFPIWYRPAGAREPVYHAITDRPVYRPGTRVRFRLWTRALRDRVYQRPRAGQRVRVVVKDPNWEPVKTFDLRTDRFGGVTGAWLLSPEAPLGSYFLEVEDPHEDDRKRVGEFQVEMYRKPEFEVRVEPVERLIRPGEKARVRITAHYYFGGPVAGGKVRYRVLRGDHEAVPPPDRPYDWLYGPGYGQYGYCYPWLKAKQDRAAEIETVPYDRGRNNLVARGEVRLNAQGTAEVVVHTSASPAHRLIFEVEVRDESRRTIEAQGQVLVSPQELAASIELDRGWYAPKSEAVVDVTLRTATGAGSGVPGTLRLTRITYSDSAEREPRLETLRTWPVRTDRQGRLTTHVPLPTEGQYQLEFLARAARNPVSAKTVFWVHGPHFNGKAFRYADLEIIPDRRSYAVGDTAHLLVHVAQPNARVLWSSDARGDWLADYRLLDVSAHATVIDLRIEPRHVPNLFAEATVVGNGRVHTETCELFVPPVQDLLQVQIQTNRKAYRPGEEGSVRIAVQDPAGKPVSGQVTLAVYDKAVTYIKEETVPRPRALIARRKLERRAEQGSSLDEESIGTTGTFACPEFEIYDGALPEVALFGGSPTGGDPADTGTRGPHAARPGPRRDRAADGSGRGDRAPKLRSNFADTALWQAALELGPDGTVETKLPFPESLTTWRLRAHVITEATQVGDATSEVRTTKDLLVRLQTPRFLVEGDEVVLSANIHNALKTDKRVTAELAVPVALLRYQGAAAKPSGVDQAGKVRLRLQVLVKAGATQRCDWPFQVLKPGQATITVKALTDEESDGLRRTVPILAHGVQQSVAHTGRFGPAEEGEQTVTLAVPQRIDPDETYLEVSVSPGPIGPMLDALPFLIGYPYGCTEQTMSRFYPSIASAEALKKLGTDLEAIGKRRVKSERNRFRHAAVPVFDSAELRRMAEAGLERLYNFQHQDGGWGWWQNDVSSPYMTAYVLMGLQTARRAGFPVRPAVLERGYAYLLTEVEHGGQDSAWESIDQQRHTAAYVAYVLSLGIPRKRERSSIFDEEADVKLRKQKHLDAVFRQREQLTPYGQALLALALHQSGESGRARLVLRKLLGTVRHGVRGDTAWLPTSTRTWWYWWDSDIETNAWVLRATLAIDPRNQVASALADGGPPQRALLAQYPGHGPGHRRPGRLSGVAEAGRRPGLPPCPSPGWQGRTHHRPHSGQLPETRPPLGPQGERPFSGAAQDPSYKDRARRTVPCLPAAVFPERRPPPGTGPGDGPQAGILPLEGNRGSRTGAPLGREPGGRGRRHRGRAAHLDGGPL
jgi:uncharacterized protein YfaS (alpha-2-macroglobulin family)